MEKFKKTKKVITALGFASIPVVAMAVGYHYEPDTFSPIFETVKLQASDAGTAAVAFGGSVFMAKFAAAVGGDWFRSRNVLVQKRHEEILNSNSKLVEAQEAVLNQEKLNETKLNIIIEDRIETKALIADLEIAPTSIKNLATSTLDKYKAQSIGLAEDATHEVFDGVMNVADTVVDKGVNMLTDKLDQVIEKI